MGNNRYDAVAAEVGFISFQFIIDGPAYTYCRNANSGLYSLRTFVMRPVYSSVSKSKAVVGSGTLLVPH